MVECQLEAQNREVLGSNPTVIRLCSLAGHIFSPKEAVLTISP